MDLVRKSNSVYFTFGRFQPPTTGHKMLIDAIAKKAKQAKADYYIVPSASANAKKEDKKDNACEVDTAKRSRAASTTVSARTATRARRGGTGSAPKASASIVTICNKNKNPIPFEEKYALLTRLFPGVPFLNIVDIAGEKPKSVFTLIDYLKNKGYTTISMVVGSDRVNEFNDCLRNTPGVSVINVTPERGDANPMSGTLMRTLAAQGKFDEFKDGIYGADDTLKLDIFNAVRQGLCLPPMVGGRIPGGAPMVRVRAKGPYTLGPDERPRAVKALRR